MNRVIVVGTTGSGKTTLAQQLAERMRCPSFEFDALFWNAGWVQTPHEEFRRRVAEAIASERWTASGNYSSVRDLIWQRADTLVWLDYPLPFVMARLLRRTMRRVFTREELWNGNRERFRDHFFSRDSLFLWALKSHPRQRRTYPAELQKPEYTHLQVFRFQSPGETEVWLNGIAPVVRETPVAIHIH